MSLAKKRGWCDESMDPQQRQFTSYFDPPNSIFYNSQTLMGIQEAAPRYRLISNAAFREPDQSDFTLTSELYFATITDPNNSHAFSFSGTMEHQPFLGPPVALPSMAMAANRKVELELMNPFARNQDRRHRFSRNIIIPPMDGEISSYIKVKLRAPKSQHNDQNHSSVKRGCSNNRTAIQLHAGTYSRQVNGAFPLMLSTIPPAVGMHSAFPEDQLDGQCLKFSMAQHDQCVKHAVVALSGSYLLDYNPQRNLRDRVNYHYDKAKEMISVALRSRQNQAIGQGDNLVAAIMLLLVDDCVNWELRINNAEPNWILAASAARHGYANWVALACILSELVTPLACRGNPNAYGWLLAGTQKESWKIHGGTGLCPKLLHIISQITYLSILVKEDSSMAPIYAAKVISDGLKTFHQWSELSSGYPNAEELLQSCDRDANGKVTTAAKVTELTGETWVAAAQIYLHCRLLRIRAENEYRKPRHHPDVQRTAKTLWKCVTRMPYSGSLFTSQAPFCPIFIASLVSIEKKDRMIAEEWFTTVGLKGKCRSVCHLRSPDVFLYYPVSNPSHTSQYVKKHQLIN
ncbi:hypothetical protein MGYG_08464 [Nannizzia gypsea CBS 118893]|uniref:Transcription factor domain-containing protein n=1 Tax=Arthroderma gypseum (strain ATCC MYA-4604 / CBS 118893) TaxID=535722 RepID=E4V5S7_ARTGP|nr:hypothetical protein MGYG_08464 [Nannizzia gypsea CBS 118893]EFR05452.1 hypothetical protein MGYG_08464 [Nannizzia gypsea CBS 118893]